MVVDEAQFDLSRVRRVDEFERADDRSVESPIVQNLIGRIAAMKQTQVQAGREIGLGIVVARE